MESNQFQILCFSAKNVFVLTSNIPHTGLWSEVVTPGHNHHDDDDHEDSGEDDKDDEDDTGTLNAVIVKRSYGRARRVLEQDSAKGIIHNLMK